MCEVGILFLRIAVKFFFYLVIIFFLKLFGNLKNGFFFFFSGEIYVGNIFVIFSLEKYSDV